MIFITCTPGDFITAYGKIILNAKNRLKLILMLETVIKFFIIAVPLKLTNRPLNGVLTYTPDW